MAQAALDVSPSTSEPASTELVKHEKRPQWGAAILLWERGDTRAYQFEDARVRKIRKGYYKFLVPAELGERAEDVRRQLTRVAEQGGGDDRSVVDSVAPFDAQIELFTELYPKGFQDPEWIEDHRTTDGAPLKRHRDPIVEEAKEALAKARFEEAIANEEFEAMAEIIADLLARTDLVPVSHAKTLRGLDPEEMRLEVESAADLLHGERSFDERFRDRLKTQKEILGGRPSWRIATVLPALVFPEDHVAVRRSAFLRQAGSIAPTAKYSRRATVLGYRNFRRVAQGVRERLSAAGHEPRDLLDVRDFVWATLRTAALDHLDSDE